ncbi:MAG: sodium:proton antiporter [Desulfurococcaceae archaeon]|jgi:multicomponent Na+:H+ antiporter subunit C|nr:sodium:proton antiporter [Desulfurococcaceae archaeon]
MSELNTFLFNILLFSLFFNVGISLYGIFARPSLIKKIIALTIFSDTANVLAIAVGYRGWPSPSQPPIPPVITTTEPSIDDLTWFARQAVDPLPQALVLTAIVIGLAVTLFLVFLTLQVYRLYGTTDVRRVARLRG